jgi:hypothetical protein
MSNELKYEARNTGKGWQIYDRGTGQPYGGLHMFFPSALLERLNTQR